MQPSVSLCLVVPHNNVDLITKQEQNIMRRRETTKQSNHNFATGYHPSKLSGYSHHTLCCSVAASCGSDLCSTNYSKLCYFAIYLHGESLSEQLTNATIQLRVRFKLHQRQQRLKHLHRLPNAITTLVILNPLLHGY